MTISIILLGTVSAALIIGLLELLHLDQRTAGGLILTAIGFIYVGFAGDDTSLLLVNGIQASVAWVLAYGGVRRNMMLIPLGLLLHAAWDLGYHYLEVGTGLPEGYEFYCVVVDLLLAGWLRWRFKRMATS